MSSEIGEMWAAIKEERKQKRASNRESSPALLEQNGIEYETKNGVHLIVKHNGVTVDFWPSTGLWIERGTKTKKRGVRKLLKRLGAA